MKIACIAALGLMFAAGAAGQTMRSMLAQLGQTRDFTEVAIAPDGQRVAFVEAISRDGVDTGNSAIYVEELRAGSAPLRLSAGDGRVGYAEHGLAWSPDSRQLAFLSNRAAAPGKAAQMQLCVAPAAGGPARQLTDLTGYLADPAWSPSGQRIAFLYAANAPGGGGPLNAEPAATGVIGGATYNQRLTVVAAAGGAARPLSPANLHVYEYDWSPDGRQFALTAAPGPGDNNWWVAQLYTLPAAGGAVKLLFQRSDPEAQIAMPRWSPDGSKIAFVRGLMSDEGFTGGDLVTVGAAGGAPVNHTPGRKSSVSSVAWSGPGHLVFSEYIGGGSAISALDLASGTARQLWQGNEGLHAGGNGANLSLSRDGRTAAAIREDWQHPPEVWAGPIGSGNAQWTPVTRANQALKPVWGAAKSLAWSSDGYTVQGWLLYPSGYDAKRTYPMVVSVHGGPANLSTPRWPSGNFEMSLMSGLGYFVFFPNPRGSYGQGEAFTRANVKNFGGGDLRDILAGVDAVIKSVPVDGRRLGIAGWSYGGYMTMWAVTQTHRFQAAVAGAGIANWQSYYGENSIDQWMTPYFGATVYDDPAVYAKSSPITFIKNAKTPTLIVVGERDGECPAPQSYEFWHALETLGVKTQLVVYPGEGHRFRQTANKVDVMERAAAWLGGSRK